MRAVSRTHLVPVAALTLVLVAATIGWAGGPGQLDAAFGTAGIQTTDFNGDLDDAGAVAVGPGQKLVLAGRTREAGGDFDFGLVRYLANGDPDATFGNAGKVVTDFFGNLDTASAIAIRSNEKILAAGSAETDAGKERFAIAQYEPDGDLDLSFGGGDGMVTTAFSRRAFGYDLRLLSGGSFIVVGEVMPPGGTRDFALAKYGPNGGLDQRFSNDGKRTDDFFGGSNVADSVGLQNGKILVVGSGTSSGGNLNVAAARYRMNGRRDDSFGGGDGLKLTDLGNGAVDYAEGLRVLDNGKFVVAAYVQGATVDFGIAGFNSNGGRDLAFGGGDGFTAVDFGGSEVPHALTSLGGKYYVAGTVGTDFGVVRYGANGNVDNAFGAGGLALAGLASAAAYDSTAHGDGVVLVGFEGPPAVPSDWDFAAARFQT